MSGEVRSASPSGLATVGDEGHRASGHVVPRDERHPEDRPRRRAQRLRRQRVGAAVGEGDGGAERIRRADERADVPRVGQPPERETGVARRAAGGPSAGTRRSRARGAAASTRRRAAPRRRTRPRRAGGRARPRRRRAASTRSSPSTAKRPVSSRCLRCPRSFRTSFSVALSREVITRPVSQRPAADQRRARRMLRRPSRRRPAATRPWPSRPRRRTPSGRRPRGRRATSGRARSRRPSGRA